MFQPKIYPQNFKEKIAFSELINKVSSFCSNSISKEYILQLDATTDRKKISNIMQENREMNSLLQAGEGLPSLHIMDIRNELKRLRPQRTYLEEEELIELRNTLRDLHELHHFFLEEKTEGSRDDENLNYHYPSLALLFEDCPTFPKIEENISKLFNDEGRIRDNATRELYRIRGELKQTERSLSGLLNDVVRRARKEGWIEADVSPSVRDGRLVIPVEQQFKRKIKGIVYDESATGKTAFIEPIELVEANNKIRELEVEERKEIMRILLDIANKLRPNLKHILIAYEVLAYFDSIRAKARWAIENNALCPKLSKGKTMEWFNARHPILEQHLKESGRKIVPLDISLNKEARILIISGPNAGGKSVCLKTLGLLQYMYQAGLPIPISEHSTMMIFSNFFLDIGDDQSLEDDLSTYSSHLANMKHLIRNADRATLLLIDEFGGGTEPTIGGAIAQSILEEVNTKGSYGIITTHYQNIKNYAEEHKGLVNSAMLYDRHQMQPLFKLSIGRPGSSFAIEIARKIGLPENVIERASEQVGADYVAMDKYLQDIIRDKRYWETKRQNIRKEEKRLEELSNKYSKLLEENQKAKKEIISQAQKEAKEIIKNAGRKVEQTIKEIKEAEAERERTLSLRRNLQSYADSLEQEKLDEEQKSKALKHERELAKILRRRQRKAEQKAQKEKASAQEKPKESSELQPRKAKQNSYQVGDFVYLDGQKSRQGEILELTKNKAIVAFGVLKMTVELERLSPISESKKVKGQRTIPTSSIQGATSVIDQIHNKRLSFKSDLDIRGYRASEGVETVMHFIDDALQLGILKVRILHGTGTGALKEAVRTYLKQEPNVRRFTDEHVQLGGAGITIVELG